MQPVGAGMEPVGAGMEPVGAGMEPVGAGVEPVGAGVEPVGAGVEPVGAGVEPVGANPLLLIARAAATAPRVRFGQAVLVSPFWHPIRLAEDIATTDLLTGGRLDIGLGRGYQPLEFHGFDTLQDRSRAMFEEHFELMRLAWTQDDFTFSGRHYTVPTPITVLPRPLQQPHPPIWLAVQRCPADWRRYRVGRSRRVDRYVSGRGA